MNYEVVLYPSEEGFAVGCPALPGCWSQGVTEEEAIENIRDAISEYLSVIEERMAKDEDMPPALIREVEVVA